MANVVICKWDEKGEPKRKSFELSDTDFKKVFGLMVNMTQKEQPKEKK